ncbi:putative RNA 3'-terminal phosphate cyclase-like protein [Nymphaea thermarum]|nr:putative RNA 3'-terminal phosphate cyclase-like protein [Nymphaea thermarum]
MVKISFTRLHGCQQFRLRLLLSTLSNNPIIIDDIRSDDSSPGLRPYEISLLRLLEKLSDDCVVEINETGTKLKYKPGVLLGGRNLTHDCGPSRSIGYFLEPLIVLGLFGKRNLSITLKGITNDNVDPCVDTFRMTTLHMLKHFGVPSEGLELKIQSRGSPPLGGGEVHLQVPIVHSSLSAVNWVDEGMVKRIRGVTYSTKVSPQMENRMVNSARGIFNPILPDVYIFTDHKSGPQAGRSPGYGISVVAETTTGCLISAEASACYSGGYGVDSIVGEESKHAPTPPEDLGVQAASLLLEEIKQGGVVDSTHQGLLFLLCALCPQDVSKVRVGKLSPYAVQTLRNIRDFLGVKFVIKADPATNTVVLKCVGCGLKNLSRKMS